MTGSRVLGLVLIAAVVVLSRLFWITDDIGLDPDAYRVLEAAESIATGQGYMMSRPPGYPVYEYLIAFVPDHTSPFQLNMVSVVFGALCAVASALILWAAGSRHALFLAFAIAMAPVVYIASIQTMDYIVALAFILFGFYFALTGRPVAAGLCLGLAIGTRITSGAMIVPMAYLLATNGSLRVDWRSTAMWRFIFVGLCSGAILYLPVFLTNGADALTFFDDQPYPGFLSLFKLSVFGIWGQFGALALALLLMSALLPSGRETISANWSRPEVRRITYAVLLTVGLYTVAFLRLPHESAYLIMLVPMAVFAIDRLLPDRPLLLFGASLIFSSFFAFTSAFNGFLGPVQTEAKLRAIFDDEMTELVRQSQLVPGNSIFVAGWKLPRARFRLRQDGLPIDGWIELAESADEIATYRAEGKCVYYLPFIEIYSEELKGVDLASAGALPLGAFDTPTPPCDIAN